MRLALFPDPYVQHQLHKTRLGKCLFSQILNGTLGILSFIPLCLSLQTLLGINWHVPPGPLVPRTAANAEKAYYITIELGIAAFRRSLFKTDRRIEAL